MKRKDIYKWMYEKSYRWATIYQLITMYIRQPFYIFTGRKDKSVKMITEHFEWNRKRESNKKK